MKICKYLLETSGFTEFLAINRMNLNDLKVIGMYRSI